MMKRKLLSLLLAVCLMAGLLPAVMGSAETTATDAPTTAPTGAPASESTSAPTSAPTTEPTTAPTTVPTTAPTTAPTSEPTSAPTTAPTTAPTAAPTAAPTTAPTTMPASVSTTAPTVAPTTAPTTAPTAAPTAASATPTATPASQATSPSTLSTTPVAPVTRPSASVTSPIGMTITAPTMPMPTGVIDPTSSAVSVSIKLCETSATQTYLAVLTATKGGTPVYAVTNDAGIPIPVTDGSIPTDNYVKFEYPQNDLPTITLMNAKLRSSGNILNLSSFDIAVKIMVIGDSTIESTTKCGIVRSSYGDITILGPSALTLNCYSSAIAFEGDGYPNSLILKELTLKATTSTNVAGRVFQIPAGNLTIDGCALELINRAGIAVHLGQGNVADARSRGNATVSNSVISVNSKNAAMQLDGSLTVIGSNIQLASDALTLSCGGNFTADNSTLFLEGRSNTLETVNVGGAFTLRASNAEISGTRYAIFNPTTLPELIGEYTVVAGTDRASATTYDEALAGTYQYFFAESLVRPTDLPTAPTGTDTDPTEFFTEATIAPSTAPTIAPTEAPTGATVPTLPLPTVPVNNASGGNNVLFWVLAIVMILGACGAATMAILMLRRNANAELEEDEAEEDIEE